MDAAERHDHELTETGESRVNGYLFVLERSLKTFLPPESSATRCARSNRTCASGSPRPTARRTSEIALEKILGELGPPLRVAQGYSAERVVDEAVATGRRRPGLSPRCGASPPDMIGFCVALARVGRLQRRLGVPGHRDAEANLLRTTLASGRTIDRGAARSASMFPAPAGAHDIGGYWLHSSLRRARHCWMSCASTASLGPPIIFALARTAHALAPGTGRVR